MLMTQGDLFTDRHPALGHGVNCRGLMGAGIAITFKRRYPEMFDKYKRFCDAEKLTPGMVYPYLDDKRNTWIYNMATQNNPGKNAHLMYVEECAEKVLTHADENSISYVAIPLIGCGIGGLSWQNVQIILEKAEENHEAFFHVYYLGELSG